MARPLRIEYAGAVYHVTSRGNRKEAIYLEEEDRSSWLKLFGKVCERFNWTCHAYCLMDNHYHIVVETMEANLSQGMRQLNGVYTQRFNRVHQRVGHVFQGRFKAIIVDKDNYLLELARYVVLNPVRAGLVPSAEVWPWSSYLAMVGRDPRPDWLAIDELLGHFGKRRKRAIEKYIEFVQAGVKQPSLWQELNGQIYLGDEGFASSLQGTIDNGDQLSEVPKVQRQVKPKAIAHYASAYNDPKTAMAEAYFSGGYTLKSIADAFGVHYSTVSRAVKRSESGGREN